MRIALVFVVLRPTETCRAAICFVGHVRSFLLPRVRDSIKKNFVEALGCETESFFYLATEADHGRNGTWDSFRGADVDSEVVTFGPTTFHPREAPLIRHSCPRNGDQDAYYQLYKNAACFEMIKQREQEAKRFDWVLRARPDVAWITKIPPLSALAKGRIYLSTNYYPIADHVALMDRDLAAIYFSAIETFYDCTDACPAVGGGPENVLFRHLVNKGVPVHIVDDWIFVVVRYFEGPNCVAINGAHRLSCAAYATATKTDITRCQRTVDALYRSLCQRTFPDFPLRHPIAEFDIDRLKFDLRKTSFTHEDDVLVTTTSGLDSTGAVVGQLATVFTGLRQSNESPRRLLTSALADQIDSLTTTNKSNASLALHLVTMAFWDDFHAGTTRCVPQCTTADVVPLMKEPSLASLDCGGRR